MGGFYIPRSGGPGGVNNYVWDPNTLDWVPEEQAGGGGGGGGDASAANQTTEIARLTSILAQLDVALSTRGSEATLADILAALPAALGAGGGLKVDGSGTALPVSGTFWQATQPVSGPLTDTQLRASAVPISLANPALTASSPGAVSVGTSSGAAVSANANRKGLVLVNTSSATISLAFGAAAVLNSGITLDPGAAWTMTKDTFTTAEVRAIAGAAASNLAYQEFT